MNYSYRCNYCGETIFSNDKVELAIKRKVHRSFPCKMLIVNKKLTIARPELSKKNIIKGVAW